LGAIMVGIIAAFVVLLVGFAVAGLWWWFAFTKSNLYKLVVGEWTLTWGRDDARRMAKPHVGVT